MTKTKSTKRALFSSALALLLCCTMLLGTTFAWFTDEVKTGSTTITSGTLDIVLEYKDAEGNWQDAENRTLQFVDKDDNDLWEPGCTYELPAIRVRNNGNLALKYDIVINGVSGNAELLEAIDFTANGEAIATYSGHLDTEGAVSGEIVIKGHMKETAGNEYQDCVLDGVSIAVYATQYTYEFDSFDNTYDKVDAIAGTTVSNAAELEAAIEGDAEKVIVAADIADFSEGNTITVPADRKVTLDLAGHTLTSNANDVAIEVKGEMTITNGVLTKAPVTGAYPSMPPVPVTVNGGTLTLENVTVNVAGTTCDAAVTLNTGTLNLNEGTVINVGGTSGETYGVWVLGMTNNTINFNGGQIVVNAAADADAVGIFSYSTATINATSGKLSVNGANAGADHIGVYTYSNINIVVGNDFTFDIAEGATESYGNVSKN